MGFFDFFKKEDKPDKEVERIFGKIHNQLTAKQMVNQAISFRNLRQYDKAKSLLKDVIQQYNYLSAKTILGTTLLMEGKIDEAEKQFKKMLAEHSNIDDYPLVEVYANLGSLYHNYRKDDETALKYYDLALNSPKPKDRSIDDKSYAIMVSNVHHDLCLIHFGRQAFQLAKEYALNRLFVVNDCPLSSKVYGCCLFYEVLQKGINLNINEKHAELEQIVKYLQIAIESNPNDYACISYCALSLLFMRQMKYYLNLPFIESMKKKEIEYVERLRKDSDKSDNAKAAYKIYEDFANNYS